MYTYIYTRARSLIILQDVSHISVVTMDFIVTKTKNCMVSTDIIVPYDFGDLLCKNNEEITQHDMSMDK